MTSSELLVKQRMTFHSNYSLHCKDQGQLFIKIAARNLLDNMIQEVQNLEIHL